jgi:hypothetical protein
VAQPAWARVGGPAQVDLESAERGVGTEARPGVSDGAVGEAIRLLYR